MVNGTLLYIITPWHYLTNFNKTILDRNVCAGDGGVGGRDGPVADRDERTEAAQDPDYYQVK